MASTQNLTDLPVIQYTGMDYTTVISQIKEIIESNTNWASNWTEFYNSEAGTMLIQLMAWICDNLAVRQDLIYNENYLSTATSNEAKRRLLKQIGYSLKSASASIVPINIEFQKVVENDINLSITDNENISIRNIKNSIFKFYGNDRNGKSVPYEILYLDKNKIPEYTHSIKLKSGKISYDVDSDGNQLVACEGNTIYTEFTSSTKDGPVFVLENNNIDLKTLKVYDVTDEENPKIHQRVDNFLDTNVINGENICYIVEQNDNGYYQIRYPSVELLTYSGSELTNRLFKPESTIGVFYRTCNGNDSNIAANYLSVTESVTDILGESLDIKITNLLAGYNGKNAEELNSAVKNAPLTLCSMNRAVTIEDYDKILKNNSLVLNVKSFSPENSPTKFEEYYGRKIEPHEVFSFILMNKNFNSTPNSKLNYYPWIELNQESIVNEKYTFGQSKLNQQIQYGDSYINGYIKYDYNYGKSIIEKYNKGQWFVNGYDEEKDGKQYKAKQYPYITLIKTSDILQSAISSEKESGDNVLKIKIQKNASDEIFIDNIMNVLENNDNLTTSNNTLSVDTNASYTSFALDENIDCKKYKYLKFVLDDTYTILVDLQKQAQYLYTEFNTVRPNWEENLNNIEYYSNYYLKINNAEPTTDAAALSELEEKYGTNTREYYIAAYSYHNSIAYAQHRKGIVQLIKEAISNIINYTKEIDYNNLTGKALEIKTTLGNLYSPENLCKYIVQHGTSQTQINSNTYIYKYDGETFVIQYTQDVVAKVLKIDSNRIYNEEINKTETNLTKKDDQQLMYDSVFATSDGTYVDLNLQIEDQKANGLLEDVYYYESDNSINFYSIEDKKNFYKVKINGRILAIRLDAYSAISAYNYYVMLGLNNDAVTSNGKTNFYTYDYFPYFGKGELKENLAHNVAILLDGEDYKYYDLGNNNSNIISELSGVFGGYFSKRYIDINGEDLNPRNVITYNSSNGVSSNNINKVSFSLFSIANIIEYALSPLNFDKNIIFEFKNDKWYDLKTDNANDIKDYYGHNDITNDEIKSFRLVSDGKIRARTVIKSNYETNRATRTPLLDNNYSQGYEYDIRFEYMNCNGNSLEISSVPETYIEDNEERNVRSEILGSQSKDLIKELYGKKKIYTSTPVDFNVDQMVFGYGIGFKKLLIKSGTVGDRSSLYFIRTAENSSNDALASIFGLKDNYVYNYQIIGTGEYYDRARTIKAYGKKTMEMFIGDSSAEIDFELTQGIPISDKNVFREEENEEEKQTITIGDIICVDSDINSTTFEGELYLSYKLDNVTKILINKQDNFYYSSNEESNDKAKPPIIGIEGESVYYNEETGRYYIDNNKSNFGVKLTKEPVDTNNYYGIVADSYKDLSIIENKNTEITMNQVNGYSISGNSAYEANGIYYNIDNITYSEEAILDAVKVELPFVFSIDQYTDNCPKDGEEFIYDNNPNDVIAILTGSVYQVTGNALYNALILATKNHSDEYINENYHTIIKRYQNSIDKIIISGISKTENGNITFYYPETSVFAKFDVTPAEVEPNKLRLATKLFYKMLFGTNLTNPEFYKLYPKEEMIKINSEKIVTSFNDEEYFYCPDKSYHLKFVYREFVDENREVSKYGDYYIRAEANGNGFADGYNFYLNKTDNSKFPDAEFYLHFINDRTYEPDRETEEDAIIDYMKQYQIIGTELHLLKPYFKTFDIVGKINYNANYDVQLIKSNVENALKEKYRIDAIENISIGNNVYRSDIYKTVFGVEGVDSFELEYFGYDYTNKEKYPDQKYSLNISSAGDSTEGTEFYLCSVLADSNNSHGIILTYTKSEAETL